MINKMVTCELDKEISGELLGLKLPAWQALLLHRVLPSCGGLIIYIVLICYDFTIIVEHFLNGSEGMGVFCTILIGLPSLISLVFTLASPPPGFRTDHTAFSVTVEKGDIKWLIMQFVNAIFFPIAAIGRYCYLIFWWVEAVSASRSDDKERTKEAIRMARAPSPVELYLFLQSFLHAAPHAIINILDLMVRWSDVTYDRVSVQAISIVASTLRMASTATMYRRFEREKICGRKYPWRTQMSDPLLDEDDNDNDQLDDTGAKANKTKSADEETIYESITKKNSIISENSNSNQFRNTNSDLIKFSPRNTVEMSSAFFDNEELTESDTSSDYLPPKREISGSQELNSDDEYVRPITIIDRVAPLRRNTDYTIEKVEIIPPPVMMAPRPMSLAVWAEKMMENAESIPTWLSAPPRRKYCDEVVQDEPDIPRRVPRSFIRGLEPQDATAAMVHFLGWYSFFVARLLSIACFINFFPFVAIIVLFSHYQVMLLFLIVPQASTVRRAFYIFLAFIYLFCLMEFKIRFRHVRVWHVFWVIVCTIETVVVTGLWISIDNTVHEWWRYFIVKVIVVSLTLSYICFLFYFVVLQPREAIVYLKNNKNNEKS
ncbi:hypothetical protein HW555_009152 [Spodoptera exigua]|uniref:XK-related protein n=1 Tax=Spodoptera exigua TaxID=7107 RepID=A0A835GCY1_SPOEX|nr:hypothetical protein HW555_009152 [Spodoptera exigua]